MRKGNYPGFVSSLIMEIIIYWNHENEDGFFIKYVYSSQKSKLHNLSIVNCSGSECKFVIY